MKQAEKTFNYDVAVIGAGPGGFASAIAAARQGARVLLLERSSCPGGLMVSGIPLLGYTDKNLNRVIGGIAYQYIERLTENGSCEGIVPCPQHYSIAVTDPAGSREVLYEMLEDAHVDVLLHAHFVDCAVRNEHIESVYVYYSGVYTEIKAKIYIDATGNADLAYLSGAQCKLGNKEETMQPPSILFSIGNINKERFYKYLDEHPEDRGLFKSGEFLRQNQSHYFVGMGGLYKKLSPLGKWPMQIWALLAANSRFDDRVYINGPRMPKTDSTDIEQITKAEIEGQKQAFALLRMLKEHVPGFENSVLSGFHSTIGIREARHVIGMDYLTSDRAIAGEVPDTAICLSAYPIDVHSAKDATSTFTHIEKPFGVPFGCTVAKDIDNLMISGRAISVDSETHASIRVMASCMAIGEAAGVGAALSVGKGISPRQLNAAEVVEILKKNGAVL